MAQFVTPIIAKIQETSDVVSVKLNKQGVEFPFIAGQFMRIIEPSVTDDTRGNGRFFSIGAAPSDNFLLFTTKISQSPFKQAIAAKKVGDQLTVSGPFGKFILDNDSTKEHLFLAGGIGITPFHAILKDVTEKKLSHKITLLYSNKTPDDILFKEDLDTFTKINPNLTVIHTMTRSQQSQTPWIGRTGRIDEAMIRTYAKDLNNTIFYSCGPPTMVTTLQTMIKGMGIIDENIKIELFTGYQ